MLHALIGSSLNWFTNVDNVCIIYSLPRTRIANVQEYKEFIDAEGLMPLPTSDFHTTVCLEMRMLKNNMNNNCIAPPAQFGPSTISYPYPYMDTPIKHSNNCNNNNASVSNNNSNSNNGDLASVDSSDTYASCQTHPFLSQGDLTSDIVDMSFDLDTLDTNNLYINPLEKDTQQQRSVGRGQVKKSASGDTGLRSLGMSPMDDEYKQFQTSFDTSDRGSRVSLNETPVPKHRKTRFQQGAASAAMAAAAARPKTRFENLKSSIESLDEAAGNGQAAASSSSGTSKKTRRSSFMPGSRSIASATKLINQHLFGIQNPAPKGKCCATLCPRTHHHHCSPQNILHIHSLFFKV